MRALPLACGLVAIFCFVPFQARSAANDPGADEIARSINALGLDLYREQIKSADDANVLLSPYSISSSLAMAYLGADGATRKEMQQVLHLPGNPAECGATFHSLDQALARVVRASEAHVAAIKREGGDGDPIQLSVANRLFAQQGYDFRRQFLESVARYFDTTLAELDMKGNPEGARLEINKWVTDRTHDRIKDLIAEGQLSEDTRLALVNACYLRAAWKNEFEKSATRPEPFHFNESDQAAVPTMNAHRSYGYAKRTGYSVVTIPYMTGRLQLVVLLPDAIDGLDSVERSLDSEALADCARLKYRDVILHLPKFKLEPDAMPLSDSLKALGMQTAFDEPKHSANFDRMAPRTPEEYLYIGPVIHKAWLSLDESGTEAAAATATVVMLGFGIEDTRQKPKPVEVRVDRPFLFAIQHVESGVCLFLGRVTDPR